MRYTSCKKTASIHWMLAVTLFYIGLSSWSFSQNCSLTVQATVLDAETGTALEAVHIHVQELDQSVVTGIAGSVQWDNMCPGGYHMVFRHVGCEPKQFFFQIDTDTTLLINLPHSHFALEGIVVHGNVHNEHDIQTQSIDASHISDRIEQNMSNMLASVAGVSVVKNGNNIAKPIVHGMYGNRLTILNNGVPQSGQQWGNDHSPEIDPLAANRITVVKGANALAYPGSNMGGIILVEAPKIGTEPHIHGKAAYFYESNGRGHGLNLQLKQYKPALAWSVNGTLKKRGDGRTADYFLNNTGAEEANLALSFEKTISDKLFTSLYISTFNTNLGVLRGSHIGTPNDLVSAFGRDVPFFTEPDFSYAIDAPSQSVNHHLIKAHAKVFLKEGTWLKFNLAGQLNIRKEFDVRRNGRSDRPALSLKQGNYFAEGVYHGSFDHATTIKTGLQLNIVNNTNQPETGILPLIPDYLSYTSSAFFILNKETQKSRFELGLRYDHVYQDAVTIKRSSPPQIERFKENFHNVSGSAGWLVELGEHLNFSTSLGYTSRNPAINELYSNGLHQGVSGIEEGDPTLSPERTLKLTSAFQGNIDEKISFEVLGYFQQIADYIFLQPQSERRPTIRGVFPVFTYEQTDGRIFGLDLTGRYNISEWLGLGMTYSYIKGDDISNDIPLVFMPANRLKGNLEYELPFEIKLGKRHLENTVFEVENIFTFRQNNLLASQDFLAPPEAYNLLAFTLSTDMQLKKSRLRFFVRLNNMLNVSYRDYLNRQRYFADDLGFQATLGLSARF
ncbi:MAG: TonB-dependent receptor [Bacteroidia bacterium]